ncbi:30S ribosomal protein S3 [Candidatus Roizmanbacteria bacterium CG02_land_8_20_14_3_00_36_15]|uniref:Small ribosomal subunit protein uS3 n=2 Tax=Candidatus Roizmaniibacteriota TaxID=1752723 RepID=A0A2M8KLS8_9BACT|nr:MAG: 30S ribosomal protein S3 [Candidatus Roizmanbacteria bacterium CG03_land_8_20_14_0_80_36_21]PIV37894.1 MAG: 30S ribosomal protein S3 [Candidatus Roizmanbacteria bacterium CG02_land_8_20_14_3_00_36_15]PIY69864.1 MAG: 30S ribosomal protein S3 [Candidatus Roizmanbacteria bacterium CG_4_10_14_0_8_um_filter_36_36]PJC81702.1 MAG: 30S ribosomal protein S3 [Candidatus Roizmanbacteria bacterium CG_4_8_14_3_um_filter_36_10]PJE60869.1 MAG: 30S ribosomal protein S3 [Candidatus Roizmanbacteria bacte
MGQKANAKGLRLGILYNWSSRWFFSDKKKYRLTLISDIKLRNLLMKKLAYSSVTQIDIERAINKITLIIYSVKPGMIIGRGGKGLEELKKIITQTLEIKEKNKEVKIDLKIEPVKKPYLNSYYVAQTIAEKLIRNFSHRAVVHNAINRVIEAGAKGIKIQLGGRIAGAEISRREKYFQGKVPLSTIREDIDFARYPALTKSGYIGIKVWICK